MAQAQCLSTWSFLVILGAVAATVDVVVGSEDPGADVVPSGMGTNPKGVEEVWLDRPELCAAGLHWGRPDRGQVSSDEDVEGSVTPDPHHKPPNHTASL